MGLPRLTNAWNSSRIQLHNQYHLTFENKAYSIYVRNHGPDPPRRIELSSPVDN